MFVTFHPLNLVSQFHEAVESFRQLSSDDERRNVAQTLYDTFVRPGADQEINVDYDVKMDVHSGLTRAPRSLFDVAHKEVLNLLLMDVLPKFNS